MQKDFDKWNGQKKGIDKKEIQYNFFFYEREVWWCSLGLNVGVESDGKNNNFERPVLILKKFNGQMCWIVPLTSKTKEGDHYFKVKYESGVAWVSLSQIKAISTKRLLRKIGMIPEVEFKTISDKIIKYLNK
jgi:mRNA interferase MazF